MRIEIRPASFTDVDPIASRMREADRREVWAVGLLTPERALAESLRFSNRAWTLLIEDRPAAMWGCSSQSALTRTGSVWMLATDDLAIIPIRAVQESRRSIKTMLQLFDVLVNWVDARNELSIRWLRWLGAEFDAPRPFGALGLPFMRFEVRDVR